jgi:hypothetical protein
MSSIRATRFYQPTLAKLTGKELMFAQTGLDSSYLYGTTRNVPDFDFAAPCASHPILTRRVALHGNNRPEDFEPAFFGMGPFQITYKFSHGTRKNTFLLKNALQRQPKATGEYGASNWSFRMLYEFLCEVYNGGYPFVDTYFSQVFKTRTVYAEFKAIYETIQQDINAEQAALYKALPLKKDGTPDMRYTASKRFKDFTVWQNPIIKHDCTVIAEKIRADIVRCLSTGRIPLRKQGVAEKTKKRREELLGLDSRRFFFASGQLIKHLSIYVEVGKDARWDLN